MTSPRDQLAEAFEDREFRRRFLRDFLAMGLPYQIRATRRARGWTQSELGTRIEGGMAQAYVSKLEDPDSKLNIATAERVADAFDCALVFRLVPYSKLLDWATGLAADDLAVPGFSDDMGMHPSSATTLENLIAKLPIPSAATLTVVGDGVVTQESSGYQASRSSGLALVAGESTHGY